jgi:hypothetical protein
MFGLLILRCLGDWGRDQPSSLLILAPSKHINQAKVHFHSIGPCSGPIVSERRVRDDNCGASFHLALVGPVRGLDC